MHGYAPPLDQMYNAVNGVDPSELCYYDAPRQSHPLDAVSNSDDCGSDVDEPPSILKLVRRQDVNRERWVTDRWWTLIFIIGLIMLLTTVVKNLSNGSPGSLSHPRNYQGLACGWDEEVRHLPLLYFPLDPASGKTIKLQGSRGMCVARCPDTTDVAQKSYIAIPTAALLQDKQKETFVSITYTVRSPTYASQVFAHSICMPLHPALKAEVKGLLNVANLSPLRMLAAGLYHSLPLIMGLVAISVLISYMLCSLSTYVEGAVTALCLLATFATTFIFGAKLIVRSNGIDGLVPAGVTTMLASFLVIALIGINWSGFTNANYLGTATTDCLVTMPSSSGLCLLIQFLMCCVGNVGIMAFLLLSSAASLSEGSTPMSLDPNGGIEIIPLERKLLTPTAFPVHAACCFLAASWALETLLALAKYGASFSVVTWYFNNSSRAGYGNTRRLIPCGVPVLGLVTACQYYIGNIAYFSAWRWISRPIRVFLMTSSATRFNLGLDGPARLEQLMHPNVLQRVCDAVHNAVFSEIVIHGSSAHTAICAACRRLALSGHVNISAAVGLCSLRTWAVGLFVGSTVYAVAGTILLWMGDTSDNLIGGMPLTTALVIAIFAAYVSIVPWSAFDATTDALLYSTLIQQEAKKPTIPEEHMPMSYFPKALQGRCPLPIANVLDEFTRRNFDSSGPISDEAE